MKIEFDRVRRKGRKIFIWDVICMANDIELWMIDIEPLRNMSPRHKMDAAYPRSESLNAPEPILEQSPILIAFSIIRLSIICRSLTSELVFQTSPFGIAAINPRDDKIDRLYLVRATLQANPFSLLCRFSSSFIVSEKRCPQINAHDQHPPLLCRRSAL